MCNCTNAHCWVNGASQAAIFTDRWRVLNSDHTQGPCVWSDFSAFSAQSLSAVILPWLLEDRRQFLNLHVIYCQTHRQNTQTVQFTIYSTIHVEGWHRWLFYYRNIAYPSAKQAKSNLSENYWDHYQTSPTRSLKSLNECLLITSSFPTKANANSTMVPMCMYCLSCSWTTAGNVALTVFSADSWSETDKIKMISLTFICAQLDHLRRVLGPGWCVQPRGCHVSAADGLNLFHTTEFRFGQQLDTNTITQQRSHDKDIQTSL